MRRAVFVFDTSTGSVSISSSLSLRAEGLISVELIDIISAVDYSSCIQKPRINNEITAPELRVIGEKGENLGVMLREKALALVRHDAGLDLIEIAPTAKPPVARLMSYDKYRYEREKAEKKERLSQKTVGLKQVQISVRAAENDLLVKVKQLEKFLGEGRPVEIQMRLRGREKSHMDWARQKLQDFLKMITTEYKILSAPKPGGRGLTAQISKK